MIELSRNHYTLSTDPSRLDPNAIFGYLSRSYWANQRTKETVEKSLQHSLNFGLYCGDQQVGLARVITDYATFAYLCDVYVLEEHQGHGLGKWLIDTVTSHPDLANIRMFLLATRDAHGLYQQYGFEELPQPERWMRRLRE
ncbi:MAG: GNAT family N-acetyltransferase [Caldilineaceae bacterium]